MRYAVLLMFACGGKPPPALPVADRPAHEQATPKESKLEPLKDKKSEVALGAETSLTADVVLARIQSTYMDSIKRCYKSQLKKDATLRGKLVLAFEVNEGGAVVSSHASGIAAIEECVSGAMAAWTFPPPRDHDDAPVTASFQIAINLIPD